MLTAFRQRRDVVAEDAALTSTSCSSARASSGTASALDRPDWSEHSHSLAFTLRSLRARFLLHAMFNAYWEPLTFELPAACRRQPHTRWRRCIDTALRLARRHPAVGHGAADRHDGRPYVVQPRSDRRSLALPRCRQD